MTPPIINDTQTVPRLSSWILVILAIAILAVAIFLWREHSSIPADTSRLDLSLLAQRLSVIEDKLESFVDKVPDRNAEANDYQAATSRILEILTVSQGRLDALEQRYIDLLNKDIDRSDSMVSKIADTQILVDQYQRQLHRLTRELETRMSHRPFPFRIVSIEQWENDLVAHLEIDGMRRIVNVGQSVGEWQVVNIEPVTGQVQFALPGNLQETIWLSID